MIEYPKIETLFDRKPTGTRKVLCGKWRLSEFEYLKNCTWQGTEKIDGTNIRVYWDCLLKKITIGGRTDAAQIQTQLLAKLGELFTIDKLTLLYPDISMLFFGEGYGAKIQKGGGLYVPDGVNFALFDIFIDPLWLKRENVRDIAAKMELTVVPIIAEENLPELISMTAAGLDSRIAKEQRLAEGLVVRPLVDLFTRRGHRIIGKIKHSDF